MLTPAMLERKLVAFITANVEEYLAAQEAEETERAEIFPLQRAVTVAQFNPEKRFAETELPAIVVQVQPARGKRGMSRTSWDADLPVQVGVLTAADDAINARDNAGTFVAALRWLLTANQELGGIAASVEYVGDGVTEPFSPGQSRWMAAGELDLTVLIRGIADRFTRPNQPAPVESEGISIDTTLQEAQ